MTLIYDFKIFVPLKLQKKNPPLRNYKGNPISAFSNCIFSVWRIQTYNKYLTSHFRSIINL